MGEHAIDRFPLSSLCSIEGGNGFIVRVAILPMSCSADLTFPHPINDLIQSSAIGHQGQRNRPLNSRQWAAHRWDRRW